MTSNKKIILTIIICTILVILLIIGFFIYLSFKPVGKGEYPPLLYLEDTLWREAPTFGKLPDETDYVGEIECYLPSGIPEENFATNAFPEGSKVYKSNLSETIYVEFEDSQGVTRYASFKQIEENS